LDAIATYKRAILDPAYRRAPMEVGPKRLVSRELTVALLATPVLVKRRD
jgi:hypothetical protein